MSDTQYHQDLSTVLEGRTGLSLEGIKRMSPNALDGLDLSGDVGRDTAAVQDRFGLSGIRNGDRPDEIRRLNEGQVALSAYCRAAGGSGSDADKAQWTLRDGVAVGPSGLVASVGSFIGPNGNLITGFQVALKDEVIATRLDLGDAVASGVAELDRRVALTLGHEEAPAPSVRL